MNEKELFDALHKSAIGERLVAHMEKMAADICDSRNWKEGETKESANAAASRIQTFVDKIKVRHEAKEAKTNQYE